MHLSLKYDNYNFLNIFEHADSNGYVYAVIDGYKNIESLLKVKNELPEHLEKCLKYEGYEMFSMAMRKSSLLENLEKKESIKLISNECRYYFSLTEALGLPNNNPKEELKEFKQLLSFLKTKQQNNMLVDISLQLTKAKNKSSELKIHCKDKLLEKEMNLEMKKILESKNLSGWLENLCLACNNYKGFTLPKINIIDLMSLHERRKICDYRNASHRSLNNKSKIR